VLPKQVRPYIQFRAEKFELAKDSFIKSNRKNGQIVKKARMSFFNNPDRAAAALVARSSSISLKHL